MPLDHYPKLNTRYLGGILSLAMVCASVSVSAVEAQSARPPFSKEYVEAATRCKIAPEVFLDQQLPGAGPMVRGVLQNGLRYIVVQQASSADTSASLRVQAGSLDAPPSRVDMPHVLEHLAHARGPAINPKLSMEDFLGQADVISGGKYYAATGHRSTFYNLDTDGSGRDEPVGILIPLREILSDPHFSPVALEREKRASQVEGLALLFRKTTISDMGKIYWSLYRDPEYPPELKEKIRDDNKKISVDEVRKYHETWYVPNNATLIISSPKPVWEYDCLIRDLFSSNPSRALPERNPTPTVKMQGFVDHYVDKTLPGPQIDLLTAIPSDKPKGRRDASYRRNLALLANTLLANRWRSIGRTAEGSSLSVESDSISHFLFPDSGEVHLTRFRFATNISVPKASALLREYIGQIEAFGFSKAEIERARSEVLESNPEGDGTPLRKTNRDLISTLGGLMSDGEALKGGMDAESDFQIIGSIPDAEIEAYAASAVDVNHSNFILTTRDAATGLVEGLKSSILGKRRGVKPFTSPAEDEIISPSKALNIVPHAATSSRWLAEDARELNFENGAKVILIGSGPTGGVQLFAFRKGGLGAYSPADRAVAKQVEAYINILRIEGVGTRPIAAIAQDKGIRLASWIDEQGVGLEIAGGRPETALQLLHVLMSTEPAYRLAPLPEIDRCCGLPSDKSIQFAEIAPSDPLAKGYTVDRIFQDRLKKPGDFTYLIQVPDIRDDQLIDKYIGSLGRDVSTVAPKTAPAEFRSGPFRDFQGGLPPDTARLSVSFIYNAQMDDYENSAIRILQSVLRLKINDRLRSVEGVAYFVGGTFRILERPDGKVSARLGVNVPMFEDDLSKAEVATLDELRAISRHGISDELFKKAQQDAAQSGGLNFGDRLPRFARYKDTIMFGRQRTMPHSVDSLSQVQNDEKFRAFVRSIINIRRAGILIEKSEAN